MGGRLDGAAELSVSEIRGSERGMCEGWIGLSPQRLLPSWIGLVRARVCGAFGDEIALLGAWLGVSRASVRVSGGVVAWDVGWSRFANWQMEFRAD